MDPELGEPFSGSTTASVKHLREVAVNALVSGLLVLTPIYLAVLLLLAAMRSVVGLVAPLAGVLPDWFPEEFPTEKILSLVLVLLVCFLVGLAVRTPFGKTTQARTDRWLQRRVPGYELCRGFTQRLAGVDQTGAWQPALVEIEEALVPAFIIEVLDDGRYTVFVPSVPTPFAGAVYILTPERVHPVAASFPQELKALSRWGAGCKDLVAAMQAEKSAEANEDRLAGTQR